VAAPALQLDEYELPEVDIQAAAASAFDRLIRPPAVWTAFPAGHIQLTGQQAARFSRIGLKRNWPDHLVLHDSRLIGLEFKRPGEKLSISRWVRTKRGKARWVEGQREAFPKLKAAGMRLFVCTSVEQALMILEEEGVPMLKWRVAA
jgi:phosphoglycolate phosphatase-like HAD superfamily hydrolase